MQSLAAKTAGGGGAPQGGDPPSGGGEYAQQLASLKGADPGLLMKAVKEMKQKCAVLMVQNLERLPNVSGQLARIVPMFDKVLKEIGQAQNVNSAVRPIQMGAATPPQPEGQAPNGTNSF